MSIAFARAKKTFLGFLSVRGKAVNTLKNYACDLTDLEAFCGAHGLDFQKLALGDLESYHKELAARGLRPNSRRRKLMTAKTFLRYLSGRMDVSTIGSEKIIPPDKVEGPPKLVERELLDALIASQPETDIGWRNRAIIGVLLETGVLVSEMLVLRQSDCTWTESGAILQVAGKRARSVTVGAHTAQALRELERRLKAQKQFFYGYSRSGPNAERLTARGVEVLFKGWAEALGVSHLRPRVLRHVFVVECLKKGRSQAEIMTLLALRTPYAFRVYRQMVPEAESVLETAVSR